MPNSRDACAMPGRIKCKTKEEDLNVCSFPEGGELAYACFCPCFVAGKLAQCDSREVPDFECNGVCALYALFCAFPVFNSCALYHLVTKKVFKHGTSFWFETFNHHLFCTHCLLASMYEERATSENIPTKCPLLAPSECFMKRKQCRPKSFGP